VKGRLVDSFEDKEKVGASLFETLFQSPNGKPMQQILEIVNQILVAFKQEMDSSLEKEVIESKTFATLSLMQKGKSPRPDWFTVDLFIGFYELIICDLLNAIQESQSSGKVLGALNATFLCLIPKKQDGTSFNDFGPILCCNVIYKLIAKILACLLKLILSDIVLAEKFGFL